jgi:putative peptidoglycan lipid II flippase
MQALLVTSGVRYLALLALVLLGSVSYFLAGGLIGAFKLSDFRSALRRS